MTKNKQKTFSYSSLIASSGMVVPAADKARMRVRMGALSRIWGGRSCQAAVTGESGVKHRRRRKNSSYLLTFSLLSAFRSLVWRPSRYARAALSLSSWVLAGGAAGEGALWWWWWVVEAESLLLYAPQSHGTK